MLAQAGKHNLPEKPVARTTDEAHHAVIIDFIDELRVYRYMPYTHSVLNLAVTFLMVACSTDSAVEYPLLEDQRSPAPSGESPTLAFFVKPFDGDYDLLNYFDHSRPNAFADTNGYQLTWRGARAFVGVDVFGVDGHEGVDWLLPVDTPLFSVSDGEVLVASTFDVIDCPLLSSAPDMRVQIEHTAPNGDIYHTWYVHMNRIDVEVGQQLVAGEPIGLSGDTGCLGTLAHLHLQTHLVTNTRTGLPTPVDPYGWEGSFDDPWANHPSGAESVWLWLDGQAPSLVRYSP